MTTTAEGLVCREVVELVTEYLEGTLSRADRKRFERHIAGCPGCTVYVEQMRATIQATGSLSEEDVPPETREELLHAFRDWKSGGA
jgi:anti-sigma factor RsiW